MHEHKCSCLLTYPFSQDKQLHPYTSACINLSSFSAMTLWVGSFDP